VKLSEVLAEPAVLLDLDGRDKWQAISELTDCLVSSGQVAPEQRDAVHSALVTRERSMSTGMENGIAIPHTSVAQVSHTAVALGIAREGVDFQAIDGRPTHLVILLVNPANQTRAHIRTLAEIARLLSSGELRSALVRSDSAADALATIRAAEAVAT
jgi:PTS system nitrogen regulatory IIA component